jgi:hypothetical protein
MASEYEDRKRLTFEQAEGAEPLPSQLELQEISPELRARLWSILPKTDRVTVFWIFGGAICRAPA